MGYIALTIYILSFINEQICFVEFGSKNGWLNIWIKNPEKFIEELS